MEKLRVESAERHVEDFSGAMNQQEGEQSTDIGKVGQCPNIEDSGWNPDKQTRNQGSEMRSAIAFVDFRKRARQ